MRQIEAMAAAIGYFVLHKRLHNWTEDRQAAESTAMKLSSGGKLREQIRKLLRENKICEAENLLFDTMRPGDADTLSAALDFYRTLNAMEEEELRKYNFSHDEIKVGLDDITKQYGANLGDLLKESL